MENKLHLGVYGILKDGPNMLFVLKTRGPYKDKFDLPGGRMNHGESLLDALKREITEETGILSLENVILFDNFSYHCIYQENGADLSFYHIGLIYQINHFSKQELISDIHFEDVSEARWLPIDSIDPNQLSPFAQKVVSLKVQQP